MKLSQARMLIGLILISWAVIGGSMVSSLIYDHWVARKLATFMGLTYLLEY